VIKFSLMDILTKANIVGKKVGDVMISQLSPNYIINMGNAKAEDAFSLIQLVKDEIEKKYEISLLFEARIVGTI